MAGGLLYPADQGLKLSWSLSMEARNTMDWTWTSHQFLAGVYSVERQLLILTSTQFRAPMNVTCVLLKYGKWWECTKKNTCKHGRIFKRQTPCQKSVQDSKINPLTVRPISLFCGMTNRPPRYDGHANVYMVRYFWLPVSSEPYSKVNWPLVCLQTWWKKGNVFVSLSPRVVRIVGNLV